jgi:hypothetical protein
MNLATRGLSFAMVVIGIVLLVRTVTAGGGPIAMGVLVGLLFVAAGGGRLWAERRR